MTRHLSRRRSRRMRGLHRLAVALVLPLVLGACGADTPTPEPTPAGTARPGGIPADCPTEQPAPLDADETRTVTLATEQGDIVVTIEGARSPIAAGNFVALAECGYYDGVVFHRLVPGFVIQGGDGQFGRQPEIDFNALGTGGPGYRIQDEPVTSTYRRGTVAMARTQQPNSVGSQFFIVLDDEAAFSLAQANTYQIIGEVTAGMEAVDAIAAMPNAGQAAGNLALSPVPMEVTVSTP
jgi:cyclophilin family peptidyl-prolyl cis-trans isomerase